MGIRIVQYGTIHVCAFHNKAYIQQYKGKLVFEAETNTPFNQQKRDSKEKNKVGNNNKHSKTTTHKVIGYKRSTHKDNTHTHTHTSLSLLTGGQLTKSQTSPTHSKHRI